VLVKGCVVDIAARQSLFQTLVTMAFIAFFHALYLAESAKAPLSYYLVVLEDYKPLMALAFSELSKVS